MAQPRQRLAEDRPGGHLREVGADDLLRHSDVAAELYRGRVRRGVDLAAVADELRIHYEHLLALEEGRFDELPGPTYVIGFLRSYAGYLALDADDLVRRFKDETAYRDSRPDLSFPSPQDEGRVPTVALIALSLALVAAAYGGWYYVANVDRVVVEKVPPVPESVVVPEVVIVEAEPTPTIQAVIPAREPETPVVLAAEEIPETVAATPQPAAEPIKIETDAVAEPEPAASEVVIVKPVEAVAPEPAVVEPEIVEAVVAEPEIVEPEIVEPEVIEPEIVEAVTAEPEPQETAPEETAALIPEAPVIDTDAYVPREFGMANVGSTIRLRAQLESWIQVTGANNELLVTRILRPGDIYHVPDRPNLVLMTGNAGGIEILVGDQLAPSLGAVGAIQRRVALDPEKLLAGTATN
ncbi:MAG: RodZ domain-containing protein [Alphaproteobacteria bacterium]